MNKIKIITQDIFNYFKNNHSSDYYFNDFIIRYDEYLKIAPGNPSSNFTFQTHQILLFHLVSLKERWFKLIFGEQGVNLVWLQYQNI